MALKTSQAMEEYFCGDIWTYLHDTSGRVFRYWVYKRMFTPMEMQEQYIDQSEFTDSYASFGVIRECVQLPDGDLLIGFQDVCVDDQQVMYQNGEPFLSAVVDTSIPDVLVRIHRIGTGFVLPASATLVDHLTRQSRRVCLMCDIGL